MADTSLFSRLRRLFGSDVVIRNVGGDQLKIADINAIQTTGRFETNSLIDRFSRLYIYNNKNIFNPNLNYQTLRIQLYSDYEAMDTDPILASTLDIIADESTLKTIKERYYPLNLQTKIFKEYFIIFTTMYLISSLIYGLGLVICVSTETFS